ncbi:hypothetical protein CCR75_004575 [Bremia lactucae]|uniref:6-phosphogluconolactonase n=1 Tax=Bremia lactucae TaxID=4779 RepID=A0A976FKJ0_BRELC|nr:hypothetical protein CCR75_004575 [Bremia lactucae]
MRLSIAFLCLALDVSAAQTQPIVFAATWTKKTTSGIATFKLNLVDGTLTPYGVTPHTIEEDELNPTFIQGTNKPNSVIYALNRGSSAGFVTAMTLQPDGKLKVLNQQEMRGKAPVHVAISEKEDFISVSNYAGCLSLFPLNADGSIEKETFYQNFTTGSNVIAKDQATSHIHSSLWLPKSNNLVAADLGNDELLQFELDAPEQTLNSLRTVKRRPGSGPRHMVLGTTGDYLYVNDELSNTVGVYKVDKKTNLLSQKVLQVITTLPAGFTNTSTSADIGLSSNGKFLFVSNRGHDSVASYAILPDGTLKCLHFESSRGILPRGLVVYQDWLIVANQASDNMFVFKINAETGALTYTGNSYKIDGVVDLYVGEY